MKKILLNFTLLPKKKKWLITFVSLAVLSAGVFIFKHQFAQRSAPAFDNVVVRAHPVTQQDFALAVRAIGTLVAAQTVEMTPSTSGHIEKILVHDGGFVQKGTPLIQLDDAIYRAQYESAQANLAYSKMDYKRKVLLGKNGAIAKQAIDQAEADLKEKKATAQEREVVLKKMKLVAPFSGVVGKAQMNSGDYVTVGENLLTLTDIKHLRVEFSVPEKYLPQIKLGQNVRVSADTYPERIFVGKISYISPTINASDRTISLYADLDNSAALLKPGMYVNVVQGLGVQKQVLVVPARCLVPTLGGEQVFTIVNGKARAIPVVIGQRTADQVQVLQGLKTGDVVVTDGQLKIKDGMPVKVS